MTWYGMLWYYALMLLELHCSVQSFTMQAAEVEGRQREDYDSG